MAEVKKELMGKSDVTVEAMQEVELNHLKEIALAADAFIEIFCEFDGDPNATGEYIDTLIRVLDTLGKDKITDYRSERFRKMRKDRDDFSPIRIAAQEGRRNS